jgi:ATP-dependent Clp protease ATP-binding subunit ClpC
MFERFTSQSRRVIVLAQEEARGLNHGWIGTEHLLLGLLAAGQGTAVRVLASADITLEAARREVEAMIGRGEEPPSGHIPFTPRAKKCLELSLREALQRGDNYIGTGHLLLALMREVDGVAAQVLGRLGATLSHLRERVLLELENQPEEQDLPGKPVQVRTRVREAGAQPKAGAGPGLGAGPGVSAGLPAPGVVAQLQAEIARLRALLREHDIDPGESGGPRSAAG